MKIIEVNLHTHDLPGQQHFYRDVLQLPTDASHVRLSVQAGSTQLAFTASPGNRELVYHFAFNIPQNRFEEARTWISQRVPLIKSSLGEDAFDFANWNAHACYFLDPSGNILELIARHTLSNDSDLPFDGRSILNVSEIGIATDDVRSTVASLQDLGIPIYDGANSDTFTAVGDEQGLLIVVKRGRIWFPDTGIPADSLPLRLSISTRKGTTELRFGPS
ncbi:MAG: hypothetical protein M3328_12845 [Chloroflexota bacterium]|nr:hypothetical protein [Chloroflexota bacterium]